MEFEREYEELVIRLVWFILLMNLMFFFDIYDICICCYSLLIMKELFNKKDVMKIFFKI